MRLALKFALHVIPLLGLAVALNIALLSVGAPLHVRVLAGFFLGFIYPQFDIKASKDEDKNEPTA